MIDVKEPWYHSFFCKKEMSKSQKIDENSQYCRKRCSCLMSDVRNFNEKPGLHLLSRKWKNHRQCQLTHPVFLELRDCSFIFTDNTDDPDRTKKEKYSKGVFEDCSFKWVEHGRWMICNLYPLTRCYSISILNICQYHHIDTFN